MDCTVSSIGASEEEKEKTGKYRGACPSATYPLCLKGLPCSVLNCFHRLFIAVAPTFQNCVPNHHEFFFFCLIVDRITYGIVFQFVIAYFQAIIQESNFVLSFRAYFTVFIALACKQSPLPSSSCPPFCFSSHFELFLKRSIHLSPSTRLALGSCGLDDDQHSLPHCVDSRLQNHKLS